jgi:hypothetical protein
MAPIRLGYQGSTAGIGSISALPDRHRNPPQNRSDLGDAKVIKPDAIEARGAAAMSIKPTIGIQKIF